MLKNILRSLAMEKWDLYDKHRNKIGKQITRVLLYETRRVSYSNTRLYI